MPSEFIFTDEMVRSWWHARSCLDGPPDVCTCGLSALEELVRRGASRRGRFTLTVHASPTSRADEDRDPPTATAEPTVRESHDEAMRLADEMHAAIRDRRVEDAFSFASAALVKEVEAATRAQKLGVSVATCHTLFRSAAAIASHIASEYEFQNAKPISDARGGEPPRCVPPNGTEN